MPLWPRATFNDKLADRTGVKFRRKLKRLKQVTLVLWRLTTLDEVLV